MTHKAKEEIKKLPRSCIQAQIYLKCLELLSNKAQKSSVLEDVAAQDLIQHGFQIVRFAGVLKIFCILTLNTEVLIYSIFYH